MTDSDSILVVQSTIFRGFMFYQVNIINLSKAIKPGVVLFAGETPWNHCSLIITLEWNHNYHDIMLFVI